MKPLNLILTVVVLIIFIVLIFFALYPKTGTPADDSNPFIAETIPTYPCDWKKEKCI